MTKVNVNLILLILICILSAAVHAINSTINHSKSHTIPFNSIHTSPIQSKLNLLTQCKAHKPVNHGNAFSLFEYLWMIQPIDALCWRKELPFKWFTNSNYAISQVHEQRICYNLLFIPMQQASYGSSNAKPSIKKITKKKLQKCIGNTCGMTTRTSAHNFCAIKCSFQCQLGVVNEPRPKAYFSSNCPR